MQFSQDMCTHFFKVIIYSFHGFLIVTLELFDMEEMSVDELKRNLNNLSPFLYRKTQISGKNSEKKCESVKLIFLN